MKFDTDVCHSATNLFVFGQNTTLNLQKRAESGPNTPNSQVSTIVVGLRAPLETLVTKTVHVTIIYVF